MKVKRKKSIAKLSKLILIVMFLVVLSSVYYILNNKNAHSFRGAVKQANQVQVSSNKSEPKTLDCAKKVETGDDLLASEKTSSDCQFMGCGTFF